MRENSKAAAETVIQVKGLTKNFNLDRQKSRTIKSMFTHPLRTLRKIESTTQHALKEVSFEVKKGEFFGIVGRNGSGKSTLLKLLAGVYQPSTGNITIDGSLVPFIELGVGFHPELTGRENIFLNGALLGFSRKEMQDMYPKIVEFAELDKFMEQKLKNYSSGMQVRLAFSIAIRARTDILLIDEVLAVGDSAFQRKCYDVLRLLIDEGRTVVFVTHNMGDVERFCDRVLVLDKGDPIGVFSPGEAKAKYFQLNQKEQSDNLINDKTISKKSRRWGEGHIRAGTAQTIGTSGRPKRSYQINEEVRIKIPLSNKRLAPDTPVVIGINIFSEDGANLMGPNTLKKKVTASHTEATLKISNPKLNVGRYRVSVAIFSQDLNTTYDHLDKTFSFNVTGDQSRHGIILNDYDWSIK